MPLDVTAVRGILPRGGTILGSSRTNPFKDTGPGRSGVERIKDNMAGLGVDALIVIGGEDTLGVGRPAERRGHSRRRRAEDHRQRPRGDRLHVRLRHRGEHRHGGDRPAAHHGGEPPPGAHRRGDGPARRLDRAARRPRGRRQRHPHPGAPVRHRQGDRATWSTASRPGTRRSWWSPRARTRCTRTMSLQTGQLDAFGHVRLGGVGQYLAERDREADRQGGPLHGARATSSAAAPRPPSTGCWRPASACTRSRRCTTRRSARWWRCAAPDRPGPAGRGHPRAEAGPRRTATPRPRSSSAEREPSGLARYEQPASRPVSAGTGLRFEHDHGALPALGYW